MATEMMAALIHWLVKPDKRSKSAFLKHWKAKNTIGNRSGLIAEFLSNSLPIADFPYITWHLDGESLGDFTSYVTIGLWANADDFKDQIANYFNDSNPMLPFEKYRRRRVVFKPIEWRIGLTRLPSEDSKGVK
jgi:hypothetical protein